MDKGTKAITLFLCSWIGAILLLFAGAIRLPSFLAERTRLLSLKQKLSDRQTLENIMNGYLKKLSQDIESVNSELEKRRTKIDEANFKCLPNSRISSFLDELQKVFTSPGVSLVDLGYKARLKDDGFVKLPFEARTRCSYQGLRRLIHALETNGAGIKIEKLEFLSLDDEEHQIQLKMNCSVRFEIVG